MKKKIATTIGLSIIVLLITLSCNQQSQDTKEYFTFNKDGELLRPQNYRTWVFAGTGTTPLALDSLAAFPDFQNIYIDPVSYNFWKENGYYREGTMFVKELIRKGETTSPIGNGFFQGEAYSLSATIKDTLRFPNAPDGWEYFKYTDYEKGLLTDVSKPLGGSCISCHHQTKAGYGPFTEFYLPLRDAKNYGIDNPENLNTRKGLSAKMSESMRELN